ncbi:head morphogenesis protein [Acidovorax sp. SUPP2522]|uniref:phage minor head protein n=1 Tax=unclassified Acidovorax TaxID=2684926 RepID=UPI00234B6F6F|nr:MULTISPECIES: phage minor head protein [unclassified Acidovorax]WCM96538.1 phage minor head protein [Acidovorax sp. GBBC 1281]GKT18669.1 head morphogenesis protein [Acidovorax sp. SUPP2522]
MAELGSVARSTVEGARQQFQEQIEFLRRKLNLPSESWRDIQRAAHDRAFMVAGAAKADLLADLRKAVDQAVQGGSIGEFRKQFADIVAKRGWTGWTGEGSQAGEAWRTRVIYKTNLATSYAAGRRAQLLDPALLKRRPFWRYVHSDSVVHPRPIHKQWGDMRLTLRHDHPFWQSHFPPNDFGCECRVVAVAAPREGDSSEPPDGWDAVDPRTGTPAGVGEGWDYAPGARTDDDLRSFVQDKLIDYPPAIGKALSADVNRYINVEDLVPDFVRNVLADRQRRDPLWLGFVERADWVGSAAGADVRGYTILLPAEAPRHVDASHGFDGSGQRPAMPQDYGQLESVLNDPDALRAGEKSRNGNPTVVATKAINGETFRAMWEVLAGKRNRSLQLSSQVIKTAQK